MTSAEKKIRKYMAEHGFENRIIDFHNTDITAESTADALDVDTDRICKGLAFREKSGGIVVLASGNARVDNRKFKEMMGFRPSMLPAEKVEEIIGHEPGAINPFCLNEGVKLYLDFSIMKHKNETVFPGIGGKDSVIELTVDELEKLSEPVCWINVTK